MKYNPYKTNCANQVLAQYQISLIKDLSEQQKLQNKISIQYLHVKQEEDNFYFEMFSHLFQH